MNEWLNDTRMQRTNAGIIKAESFSPPHAQSRAMAPAMQHPSLRHYHPTKTDNAQLADTKCGNDAMMYNLSSFKQSVQNKLFYKFKSIKIVPRKFSDSNM